MANIRLIYFSRATRDMSLQDIQDILGTARENNGNLNICGMLCYEQQYFLQALEGDREAVNELYLDIADDPRHDEAVIIAYEEITAPSFKEWNMGFAPASDHFYTLLNEVGMNTFLPAQLTASQATNFLLKLSQHQS